MQLEDAPAAGLLVEAVDVLRDHAGKAPRGLKPCEGQVRRVGAGRRGLCVRLFLVDPVPAARLLAGQELLDGHGPVAAPDSARASEVGDAGGGTDAGAGEG